MHGGQLDLFSQHVRHTSPCPPRVDENTRPDASTLTDEALVAAIPGASLAHSRPFAQEAAHRGLKAAIPALEELCQRFVGFGGDSLIPEQAAALEALGDIGGEEAGRAIGRMLMKSVVRGPNLAVAVAAAARLKARLPPDTALGLLRNGDPLVRANACRSVRPHAAAIALLLDLLIDPNEQVRIAVACALGRMGRVEARPMLIRLLREAPSAEAIDAAAAIADEECCVLLGRIARERPTLASLALDALNAIDDPRAERIAVGLRAAGLKA